MAGRGGGFRNVVTAGKEVEGHDAVCGKKEPSPLLNVL
jgi:hypothetical protein